MAPVYNITTTLEIPVLISGAGPVDLTAAYLLSMLNVPVRIKRQLYYLPMSKALSLRSRMLETFDMIGLIDSFTKRGHPISGFNFYFNGPYRIPITPSSVSKVLGMVELEVEDSTRENEYEMVQSKYLVAADGGQSAVQHKLNIPFEGGALDNNIFLADALIKTDSDAADFTKGTLL
ncbi:hypothetical protein BGW38_006829 [Lunasporangiospora selenospora]|uniref:FAD-binding domain-containing protein n=1 Tax=Lunasporangiospora selenospora TaxID=979761 RepID=A0A9P6KGZ1_9FUNG|nr:hypothetical protein BGW38_006829 [Lunasporangiospora selenospora]